ncbi:AAA family ATPase [Streptomyces sp. SCUT-3]|nr:hypothetical protein C0036_26490 [Streptomyces sp. DJ]QMV24979.1 AAA family ATPase [Streptomyces sp. SCUT-3]
MLVAPYSTATLVGDPGPMVTTGSDSAVALFRARLEPDGTAAAPGGTAGRPEEKDFGVKIFPGDRPGGDALVLDIGGGAHALDVPDGDRLPVRSAQHPGADRGARGWFSAGYGPFRRMTGEGAGADSRYTPRAERFATLFDESASLSESVSWLVRQHLRRLEEREGAQELLDAVFALLGDGLLPDGHRIVRVDSDGLWVSRRGQEFPLREMSDGYRTVASLVVDLVRHLQEHFGSLRMDLSGGTPVVPLPGVVLIDEVDVHLHVSWQQRIGEWLKTHFPRIQFIVTTHSPYVCQAADPGGLVRLPGPDEDAPPVVVDEDLYRRVVYGSGDDAVLSDLFGLDSPYSPRAERLRRRVGDLEGRVLEGEASETEVEEYRALSDVLNSSLGARVDEVATRLGRSA